MRYGLSLPTGGECGDARFLLELGERAEATGWDGLFLEDYVLYGGDARTPTCAAWPTLAALAVRTSRLVLGTEVTPLARRRPWNVAREVAAVDQLSGGRAVLGVGLGDVGDHVVADASFTRLGEERDARRRGEILDEALAVVAGLWAGQPFSFHGRHFTLDEVTFLPRPLQEPRPEIWIGGGYPNRRPVERALRWDGACLYDATHGGPLAPDAVADLRRRAGDRRWTIAVGGTARGRDPDAERRHIASIRDAGADWWVEWVAPAEREAMRRSVERGPLRVG
ncbi:MAG: LLM class flavin-dependent oxidoreductase [Thermoleophilia bacterium]|nr:LLM class flavin-dependent oxidoreductase [Thermoleophilia bacterium]